jgi:hypothetical protein
MHGHVGATTQVLFTPDGRRLIAVGEDEAVRVWDGGPVSNKRIECPDDDAP